MNERVKTGLFFAAVFLLVAAAGFQIFWLFWGSDFLHEERAKAHTEGALSEEILCPRELFASLDRASHVYYRLYSGEDGFETLMREGTAFLRTQIPKLSLRGVTGPEELPARPALVFSYEFSWTEAVWRQLFGAAPAMGFPEKMEEIWVFPSMGHREQTEIAFVDRSKQEAVLYEGGGFRESESLLAIMRESLREASSRYIYSEEIAPELFLEPVFLPEASALLSLPRVRAGSYFSTQRYVSENTMREYGIQFFPYPDTVTVSMNEEGSMMLTNEKMSVRIDKDGALLYVETLTQQEKEAGSLEESYVSCVSFLNRELKKERQDGLALYLSGIDQRGEETVFLFEYSLFGAPLYFAGDPPVEVSVIGQHVRRYARHVWHFTQTGEQEKETLESYIDVIDADKAGSAAFEPIRIGYVLEEEKDTERAVSLTAYASWMEKRKRAANE